jgi:hypothetical protein
MNRATWLQDRRMQKFRDVLSRWERGDLSMLEAGELLGMSERQFRRYRDRYEESHAKARRHVGNVDLPRRHHCRRHPAYAWDRLDASGEANLGRWL